MSYQLLLIFIGMTLALFGCTKSVIDVDQISIQAQSSEVRSGQQVVRTAGIALNVPDDLIIHPSADDHLVIDNDQDMNDLSRPEEYRVEILPMYNQPCSTSITGVQQANRLIVDMNSNVVWGYVDFFDTYNSGEGGWDFDGDPPLCRPPGVPGDAAYALCAEKDGKTVVICIAQQKDNPELAKQIFESFRWTDGEGSGGVE